MRGLSGGERVAIAKALQLEEHPAGHAIVTEGEPGDTMFLIEGGQVVIEVTGVGVVGHRTVGDAFGELALISDQPRKATVRACEQCQLLCLGRDTFERCEPIKA